MGGTKMPPAVIFCGGMGTRLREITELTPKPMVQIGEQPILWHIMKSYAAFGVTRFFLCLGYKREVFVDYFINYRQRRSDFTVTLGDPSRIRYLDLCEDEADWEVTCADTGLHSMTGCRLARIEKYLPEDEEDLFLTYGDGLSDVNIEELYAFHRKQGALLTLTAVHPAGRFGEVRLDGDRIADFSEKPLQHQSGFVSGGFMVLKKSFIGKYTQDREDLIFEHAPMQNAARDGVAAAYRHSGFWQCMDNPREYHFLNDLWEKGCAPWTKYWK